MSKKKQREGGRERERTEEVEFVLLVWATIRSDWKYDYILSLKEQFYFIYIGFHYLVENRNALLNRSIVHHP
jgi:hypothetical protein